MARSTFTDHSVAHTPVGYIPWFSLYSRRNTLGITDVAWYRQYFSLLCSAMRQKIIIKSNQIMVGV